MARAVANTVLQANTGNILNTIRANASAEYQQLVPIVKNASDIPAVGEALQGYPALANQFLPALLNRVALVIVRSKLYNNPYVGLKKGYLDFGELIEEVYVEMAKAREFSVEKAAARELARTLPDVRTAFHAMNWRVQYPVTIQNDDLRRAFLDESSFVNFLSRIVDSLYNGANYDEFLLVKYLLIQGVTTGKMYPIKIPAGPITNSAVEFRANSNLMMFVSPQYNMAGVHTFTDRGDQIIFMDARFNAQYDVEVLASSFNMDKSTFTGQLYLIDNWTAFDNDRFDIIRENSDMINEITAEQLAAMANVRAIVVDREWFQLYDNLDKFTEKFVAAGDYWNYNYNVWKTVDTSIFSNAIVYLDSAADTDLPATLDIAVTSKTVSKNGTTIVLTPDMPDATYNGQINFVQTAAMTSAGVAMQRYGSITYPSETTDAMQLEIIYNGVKYTSTATLGSTANVGDKITVSK